MTASDTTMATHDPTSADDGRGAKASRLSRMIRRPETGAVAALILTYGFFAVFTYSNGFVSWNGTVGWLNLAAELGIVAVPIALLMIAGEFDLSIGSTVGAASMVLAIGTSHFGLSIWAMILLALALGAGIGLVNGLAVVRTGVPSFIVTLATNFIVIGGTMGLSRMLTKVTSMSITSTDASRALFAARWEQANVSILWWFAVAALGAWVLARTGFGNWIYATGGNTNAARGAGVPVERVKILLFVATGMAAALVGIIQGIQWNSGNATYGMGYVFQAPIVVVIGGVLLTGGYGTIGGVLAATALFGVISSGIFYTGWSTDWIQLFLGALLGAAVLANSYVRKLALSGGR